MFKPIVKEQALLQKIERGYFNEQEKSYFESIEKMRQAFPHLCQSMTRGELEIMIEKMRSIVNG